MFIVIEGIDGAGCETQAQMLLKNLKKHKLSHHFFKYPNYEENIGRIIREYLYDHKDMDVNSQFLLYSLQFILNSKKVETLRKKTIVVSDRYFSSTLCYQTLEGFKLKEALHFAHIFKIAKPDLIIYLDVPPKTAIKWKYGEQKQKNRREEDHTFIKRTYTQYKKLVKNQVWTKWISVKGDRPVNEVADDIFSIVQKCHKNHV